MANDDLKISSGDLAEGGFQTDPKSHEAIDFGQPANFSTRQLAGGSAWTVLFFGLAQLIRFGSSLILTRLLIPDDFGVMAIVSSVLLGISLFSDLGITTSLVQSARGSDVAYRNTAWTLQIMRNFLLCVLTVACAPLFASAYPLYPGLTELIQVSALGTLIQGFGSMGVVLLDRNLNVARKAVIDLSCQIVSVATMISWAYWRPSPWAIVMGSLAGSLFGVSLSHILYGRDRLCWERPAVSALLAWGKWAFLSSGLMFLAGQADRLMFGVFVPAAVLGVYGLALQLASLAPELVGRLFRKIMFPALCRNVQRNEPLNETFRQCTTPLMVVGGWGLSGLIGGGEQAVNLLYESEYSDAGWMVRMLAVGLWFGGILHGARGSALVATGGLSKNTVATVAKLLSMLALMPIGYSWGGFAGAIAGYVLSDLCKLAACMWVSSSLNLNAWRNELRLTIWLALSAFGGWSCAQAAKSASLSLVWQCSAVFVAVTLIWSVEAWPLMKKGYAILSDKEV